MHKLLTAAVIGAAISATTAGAQMATDPYIWLEDVSGARALEWVRAHNEKYLPELGAVPEFQSWQAKAEKILQDPRRIAYPSGASPSGVTATHVFNFWRDADHVRGLWRMSERAAYERGEPQWQILLDMDALEKEEGRNFQFAGATCLPPENKRCLVRLSVGGKDAVEVREFDLEKRAFVSEAEGGFHLTEAKQNIGWLGQDQLLVASADVSATTSGYAREARLWQRGKNFADGRVLLTTEETNMGLFPAVYGGEVRHGVVMEALTFWTGRTHHLGEDGKLYLSPLPEDADFKFVADLGDGPRGYALLRTEHQGIPAGSLVSYPVPTNAQSDSKIERVFTPGETQAIAEVESTDKAIYVSLLDNVSARLKRMTRIGEEWADQDIALPEHSALDLVASDGGDTLYLNVAGFTEPSQLMMTEGGAEPRVLASAPAFFDGSKFEVLQRFAFSPDGTRVPYFVVRPKGAEGPLKTYFWSYGGFEIPLTPAYPAPDVQMWLEAGNQYVLANIRGGGEYGPRWHQAALLEHRQRSYDDLHAVAERLKRDGMASKIAVHGRSNGGLMASVAYTQRPDLYDAALVGVPLADMKRYHLLLAGASWMAEYGNPDTDDWSFISKYSPYQQIRPDVTYPRVFFYTSTKDDRVHPAHARKMAARMEEQGHPIYYYENIDGGHAGVANLKESAYRFALILAYLERELK